MPLPLFIISVILVYIAAWARFSQKSKSLKQKIKSLEKEVEIQGNTLNFEKNKGQESLNRLQSITIIIMEIAQEIGTALAKETETLEEEVLSVIFEKAKSLLKVKKGILLKVNPKDNSLVSMFSFGCTEKDLKGLILSADKNSGLAGLSVATGRFISIYDAEKDPTLRHLLNKDKFYCNYFLPIKVDGKVMALVCLGPIEEGLSPLLANRLFSILNNMSSVALRDAILTQKLRQQSIRDGLTGLYNHSYFQKWLGDLLSQPMREEKNLTLAMADLDNFKKVNDTYGHLAGDEVLRRLSGHLSNLGISDYICARYGGEEFILGFLGQDLDDVFQAVDGFRKDFSQEEFDFAGQKVHVTISIGLSDTELKAGKHVERNQLIERADKALYKAKSAGKNRTVLAEG